MHDFDVEIKGLEERLASSIDLLNESRQRGAAIAVAWLRQHGEELAQAAVIANPERAKALGAEGISALRREIRALLQNAEAEATVIFGRIWDHTPRDPRDPTQANRRVYLAAAERLVGRVGDLLLSHGVIERPPGGVRSGWATGNISGTSSTSTTDILYRFERTPDSLVSAIDSYLGLLRSAGEHQAKVDRLKKKKAEAEAAALWEQANQAE